MYCALLTSFGVDTDLIGYSFKKITISIVRFIDEYQFWVTTKHDLSEWLLREKRRLKPTVLRVCNPWPVSSFFRSGHSEDQPPLQPDQNTISQVHPKVRSADLKLWAHTVHSLFTIQHIYNIRSQHCHWDVARFDTNSPNFECPLWRLLWIWQTHPHR